MAVSANLVGDRYVLLGTVGTGGMGMVYAALDRLEGQQVALKRVMAPSGYFSLDTSSAANKDLRVALTHEFRTLASLRHPHVIPVLDYGFSSAGQPYFTMPLVENACTLLDAAEDLPLDGKVDLLLQMLGALAYLHRRGVLHCDLKPANVLVDANGQVRVLDFGLSTSGDHPEGVAGTVHYLAPEVLNGATPQRTSDIYAAGVLAFDVLTGHYPYVDDDLRILVNHILQGRVNWPLLDEFSQQVPVFEGAPSLADIVRKMMAYQPTKRYQTIEAVIADWCAALGRPLPPETHAVRDGYIQATTFVGRDTELNLLTAALSEIVQRPGITDPTGRGGSAWLVGGESGVGKSRLLEELRVRALISGALVLRGQGVEGVGLPYQLVRDVVRRLVLAVPPTVEEAVALKVIVPDIGELLGMTVPDSLGDDDDKTHLIRTLVDMFRRVNQPVVLLFEDLHWSRRSLAIVQALIEQVSSLRLMIVATYRTEEWPELPTQVQPMRHLKLARLTKESVNKFALSLLSSNQQPEQVVEFLYRETEGNAFFLVEVMRVLAEEAGALSGVGQVTLPHHLFAGGMETIIARRLAQLPPIDQLLLHVAAVVGRAIDPAILQVVDAGLNVEEWLTMCSNAAILEVYEGAWHFAHDKLREYILKSMPPAKMANLRRVVALAIEKVYPTEATRSYALILADHWRAGGDIKKEHFYLTAAGSYITRSGHRLEALKYLRDAMRLFQQLGDVADDEAYRRQIRSGIDHGLCLMELNKLDQAFEAFSEARELAVKVGDEILLGTIEYYEWYRVMLQGDFAEAEAGFRQNLAWAEGTQNMRLVGRSLDGLAYSVRMQQRYAQGVEFLERALSINSSIDEPYGVAYVQIHLGYAYTEMGNYRQAAAAFEAGLATCRALEYKSEMGWALTGMAVLATLQGDWELCARYAREVIEISQQTLDRTMGLGGLMVMGRVYVQRGRAETAAEWLGLAQHSPHKSSLELQARMAELRSALEAVLDGPTIAQALTCGALLKLVDVLTEAVHVPQMTLSSFAMD